MKIIFGRSWITVVLVVISVSTLAQKNEEKYYQAESKTIRGEIWGWKNPEFAVRTIPAEFANASKVIIARHVEINADSKADDKRGFWVNSIYREYYLTEITREVVKLNDKAAVADYSEFTFTKMARNYGMFYSTESVYIGVRVIKPDGSIKEIGAEEAVLTNNGSIKKEAKLAISDLQQGDIIDYFIAKKQAIGVSIGDVTNYSFPLFEDAPLMHYSVHVAVGKRFATEYRCYNGAPDFKRQTPERKENFFDLVVKNIPASAESGLWTSPFRQLPIIRMNIVVAIKTPYSRKMNLRDPGEVYANPPADEFIEDEKVNITQIKTYEMQAGTGTKGISAGLDGNVSKYYFQVIKNLDKMPFDSAMAELYYLFRYARFLDVEPYADIEDVVGATKKAIKPNATIYDFGSLLKSKDTEYEMVFVTSRAGPHFKEILSSGDINWMLLAKADKDKLFGLSDIFSPAFHVPSEYEDTKQAITMRIIGKRKDFDEGKINIPGSSAAQNTRIETIKVSTAANGTDLQVNRNTVLKGHYKADVQRSLVLFEDYCNAERKLFGEEKTMIEELEARKSRKSYAPELKAAFDKERAKQKDAFIDEAKGWFDQPITDLTDYKIENLGVRHNNPDFVYSSKFNMGGVIKRAGNNLIIDIGKLQGSPLKLSASQRKRKLDVYMPFARSLQTQITLQVPDGYTAEGINELNKKVENETGYFITEATSDGKTVTIKVKKSYNHAFEPVGNWEKLLAFIDAANDWTNAKILLKKK